MKPTDVLKNLKVDLSKWDMGNWPERLGVGEYEAKKLLKKAIDEAVISIDLRPTDEQIKEILAEAFESYLKDALCFCLSKDGLVVIPDESKTTDPRIVIPFDSLGTETTEADIELTFARIREWLDDQRGNY